MIINIDKIRSMFPALDRPEAFLDNPGGTQIVRTSLERINGYYMKCNANHGGSFITSQLSDALVDEARLAAADFLNARSPDEIIFGANMTTLTFSMSRAIGRILKAGDTIVLTRLDHDANISPWLMLAEDRGLNVRFVDFNPEDGTLNLKEMQAALADKPALLAVGYSSNALGTINPVKQIIQGAHAAGALVYVDAVQFAPHGLIDVQDIDCDFLVCSAYKFFGPHMGVLYGRQELLEKLEAYKVRPAPVHAPGKFETGTGNFEHMAGVLGALEYFEWLGNTYGDPFKADLSKRYSGRRLTLKLGMEVIRKDEETISLALLKGLKNINRLTLYGLKDESRLGERVPTYSFTLDSMSPASAAEKLGKQGIFLWNGNFYALEISRRLGLEDKGGLIRVGAAHYNSMEEINRFLTAVADLA
ncbi:MAG: cysteine desulfurase-like protein [Anaerolineae bacterium]|nr:cysteine desulfurase-like protein [Anaerolineae bacterium]